MPSTRPCDRTLKGYLTPMAGGKARAAHAGAKLLGWGFLVMSSLNYLSHEGMETWEFAVLLSPGVIWAGVHMKL